MGRRAKPTTIISAISGVAIYLVERGLDMYGVTISLGWAITFWTISGILVSIATIIGIKMYIWPFLKSIRITRIEPKQDFTIGRTPLEQRVLRSLYMNGYFVSVNRKTEVSEAFSFRVIPPLESGFHSVLRVFNVSQPKTLPNILRIHGGVVIPLNTQQKLQLLSEKKRKGILSEISKNLTLLSGIEFSGVSDPLKQIEIEKKVILSRTNEDNFYVDELLNFNKAINIIFSVLDQDLQ